MKKKRRESGLISHLLLRATTHHSCRFHAPLSTLLPFLSAVSGCLLLFLALISLLSPPPSSSHHHLRLPRHSSVALDSEAESSTVPEIAFRVPSDGQSSSRHLWYSGLSNLFFGCSNASRYFLSADKKTEPYRYLLIATSGGLNQQRTGITDAVVAAYILNATLVVPKLDQKSYWKDSSNFDEIFDVNWFISFLSKDVKIIKQLPDNAGKHASPQRMRVPRKCTPKCYESRVLPVLKKKHAVQLTKFDYRLSNRLDKNLQKLRCRVNYHALRFTESIAEMGNILVNRMRSKTKHFIALHLRFEPDMLAFSGCYYGGGEKERQQLGAIRKRWKSLHASNPDKVRRHGRCPLTPEEVGLMLRALGYGSDVHIYVASGEVYGGEETLAPLKALFPNFHTKETIASREELSPFSSFSSRMAALDFTVCDQSDVFVTNNNGNMAKILAGRRRYFGHKPTIRPNARKLYRLFLDRNNMTWEEFASRVRTHQIGFMGEPNEVRPGRGEFHENPSTCICENSEAKDMQSPPSETRDSYVDENTKEGAEDVTDEQSPEDDQYFADIDYTYNINDHREKLLSKSSDSETSISLNSKQSETDELFFD